MELICASADIISVFVARIAFGFEILAKRDSSSAFFF